MHNIINAKCRVGMTSDPEGRKKYWETFFPNMFGWRFIKTNLTYDEAQKLENEHAKQWGCDAEPEGDRKHGKVYVVYKFFY